MEAEQRQRLRQLLALACLGVLGYGAWGIYSCGAAISDGQKQRETEKGAAAYRYDTAKAALQKATPTTLGAARETIGTDPITCDRDQFSGEAICRWYFGTPSGDHHIYVFSESDRKGARVNRVQFD